MPIGYANRSREREYEPYDYSNPLMWLDIPGGYFRGALAGKPGETVRGAELAETEPDSMGELAVEILTDPIDLIGGPIAAGIGSILGLAGISSKAARAAKLAKAAGHLTPEDAVRRLAALQLAEGVESVGSDILGRSPEELEYMARSLILGDNQQQQMTMPVGDLYEELLRTGITPNQARELGIPISQEVSGPLAGLSPDQYSELAGLGLGTDDAIQSQLMLQSLLENQHQAITGQLVGAGSSAEEAGRLADEQLSSWLLDTTSGTTETPLGFLTSDQLQVAIDDRQFKMQAALAQEGATDMAGGVVGDATFISGWQTGPDQEGLRIAKANKQKTAGTAAPDFKVEGGHDPTGAKDHNVTELTEEQKEMFWSRSKEIGGNDLFFQEREIGLPYVQRTWANVYDSDVTLWFGEVDTAGGSATQKAAAIEGKTFIANPTPEQWADWVSRNRPRTINVAGNRARVGAPNTKKINATGKIGKNYHVFDDEIIASNPDVFFEGGGTTIQGLNSSGLRTASTGKRRLAEVGDVITFNDSPVQYVVTDNKYITQASLNNADWLAETQKKLGTRQTPVVGEWVTHYERATDTVTEVNFSSGKNEVLSTDWTSNLILEVQIDPHTRREVQFKTSEGAYQALKTGKYRKGFEDLSGPQARTLGDKLGGRENFNVLQEVMEARFDQDRRFSEALSEAGVIDYTVGRSREWSANYPKVMDEVRRSRGVEVPVQPIPHHDYDIKSVIEAGIAAQREIAIRNPIPGNMSGWQLNPLRPGQALEVSGQGGGRIGQMDIGPREVSEGLLGQSNSALTPGIGDNWRLIKHPDGSYRLTQVPSGWPRASRAGPKVPADITMDEAKRLRDEQFAETAEGIVSPDQRPDFYTGSQFLGPPKKEGGRAASLNVSLPKRFKKIETSINQSALHGSQVREYQYLLDELDTTTASRHGSGADPDIKDLKIFEQKVDALIYDKSGNMREAAPLISALEKGRTFGRQAQKYGASEPWARHVADETAWLDDLEFTATLTSEETVALKAHLEELEARHSLLNITEIPGEAPKLGGDAARALEDSNDIEDLLTLRNKMTAGDDTRLTKSSVLSKSPEMEEWVNLRQTFLESLDNKIEGLGGPRLKVPEEWGYPTSKSSRVGGTGIVLLRTLKDIKKKADKFGPGYPAQLSANEQRVLASYMGVDPEAIGRAAVASEPAFQHQMAQSAEMLPDWVTSMPGSPYLSKKLVINSVGAYDGALRQLGIQASGTHEHASALIRTATNSFEEQIRYLTPPQLKEIRQIAEHLGDPASTAMSMVDRQLESLLSSPPLATTLGELGFSAVQGEEGLSLIVQKATTGDLTKMPMSQSADEFMARTILIEAAQQGSSSVILPIDALVDKSGIEALVAQISEIYDIKASTFDLPAVARTLDVPADLAEQSPLLAAAARVRRAGSTPQEMAEFLQKLKSSRVDSENSEILLKVIERGQRGPDPASAEDIRNILLHGNEASLEAGAYAPALPTHAASVAEEAPVLEVAGRPPVQGQWEEIKQLKQEIRNLEASPASGQPHGHSQEQIADIQLLEDQLELLMAPKMPRTESPTGAAGIQQQLIEETLTNPAIPGTPATEFRSTTGGGAKKKKPLSGSDIMEQSRAADAALHPSAGHDISTYDIEDLLREADVPESEIIERLRHDPNLKQLDKLLAKGFSHAATRGGDPQKILATLQKLRSQTGPRAVNFEAVAATLERLQKNVPGGASMSTDLDAKVDRMIDKLLASHAKAEKGWTTKPDLKAMAEEVREAIQLDPEKGAELLASVDELFDEQQASTVRKLIEEADFAAEHKVPPGFNELKPGQKPTHRIVEGEELRRSPSVAESIGRDVSPEALLRDRLSRGETSNSLDLLDLMFTGPVDHGPKQSPWWGVSQEPQASQIAKDPPSFDPMERPRVTHGIEEAVSRPHEEKLAAWIEQGRPAQRQEQQAVQQQAEEQLRTMVEKRTAAEGQWAKQPADARWRGIESYIGSMSDTSKPMVARRAAFREGLTASEQKGLDALADFLTGASGKQKAIKFKLTDKVRKKALEMGLGLAGLLMTFGLVKEEVTGRRQMA